MDETLQTAVDTLIEDTILDEDEALRACLDSSQKAGLPDIAVSPAQAKFLQLLVTSTGARRVLEIGTLGAYSTIHMGRGVPADGTVLSLEENADYAEVARANVRAAGLEDRIEIRTGQALDILPTLGEPFDFHFIDADKVNSAAYVEHAVRLSTPGSIIIVDNVVREGRILDADKSNPAALGSRKVYDCVAANPKLDATALQTVGSKGWDGMLIARVQG